MIWLKFVFLFFSAAAAALAGFFLSSASRRQSGKSQEMSKLESALPGYDCGLCGHELCRDYAAALDAENADPGFCSAGGPYTEKALRALLAERKNDPRSIARRAVILCGGCHGATRPLYHYEGRHDCASAAALNNGPKACTYACLGYASCARRCPLGAITIKEGLASINHGLCTGCGLCVAACPRGLIELMPIEQLWYVACLSRDRPGQRRELCKAACTGCGECVRLSGRWEFRMEGDRAKANPPREGEWAQIAQSCPTKAIRRVKSG